MARKSKIKTTAELREMLIDTIESVRDGSLEPAQARTIAALSGTVLQSAKLDLDYMRFHVANQDMIESKDKAPLVLTSREA